MPHTTVGGAAMEILGSAREWWAVQAGIAQTTEATAAPRQPRRGTPHKTHEVLAYALSDLIECGMTPIDGLRTLTTVAAKVCGVSDRKGRLAPGFDADIVAVNG